MSGGIANPDAGQRDDAARWKEWQRANAASSQRSAVQARVVAGLMFVGVIGWLTYALLGSQAVA